MNNGVAPEEMIPNLDFTLWSENQALRGANEELRALIREMREREITVECLCNDLQSVILARDNEISSYMNEIDQLRYEQQVMCEITVFEEEVAYTTVLYTTLNPSWRITTQHHHQKPFIIFPYVFYLDLHHKPLNSTNLLKNTSFFHLFTIIIFTTLEPTSTLALKDWIPKNSLLIFRLTT
ncbi:hypothetical protein CTI12_AA545860 [Artemisia annua]|uniref:Uncharacterized protein n=1 Tax=Artemisia annua TaxID=35608 RepID=A0A2U1KZZ3_ARTAN|nr:hypothetical protein CTI12_AA545860 [Artemisia annua]